jgi:hypothetical protein
VRGIVDVDVDDIVGGIGERPRSLFVVDEDDDDELRL